MQGYYKRHEDYFPTLERKRIGCFKAPVILSTYLLQLSSSSEGLLYFPPPEGFSGPIDDVVQFAFSAKIEGQFVSCSITVQNVGENMQFPLFQMLLFIIEVITFKFQS